MSFHTFAKKFWKDQETLKRKKMFEMIISKSYWNLKKKKKLSSTERSFKNGDEERHEIVNDSRTCVQFYIQINGLLLD